MSDVQARISAFEALVKSPASHARPLSPTTAASFDPIAPSPSPSPPALGRKTSLIDLHDWVVDDGPHFSPPKPALPVRPKSAAPNGTAPSPRHVSAPLIHLESPPSVRPVPPLPPRKPSYTSLRSVSSTTTTTTTTTSSASLRPAPVPPPRKPRNSLTADHSYPPALSPGLEFGSSRHAPASSISSFHSVSLSSDGSDPSSPSSSNCIAPSPSDTASIAESFEHLSVSSVLRDAPRRPPSEPPRLPQRPPSASPHVVSKSVTTSPRPPTSKPLLPQRPTTMKPPPPPPPRAPSSRTSTGSSASGTSTSFSVSDHASVLSLSTSPSSSSSHLAPSSSIATIKPETFSTPTPVVSPPPSQLTRAPPVPSATRRRYEALFARNVYAQNVQRKDLASPPPGTRTRKAAGWRGLSVDLLTDPEPPSLKGKEGGSEERLDGETVRRIWLRSKLERRMLKAIWSECDPGGAGSLDLESFIRGMWRIDEELRRAQMRGGLGLGRHSSNSSYTARGNAYYAGRGPRLILR